MRVSWVERLRRCSSERLCEGRGGVVISVMVEEGFGKYLSSKARHGGVWMCDGLRVGDT